MRIVPDWEKSGRIYSISGQKSDKMNFSIWNVEQLIFGYYENEDEMKLSEDEKAAKDSLTEKIPGYLGLDINTWRRHASDVS